MNKAILIILPFLFSISTICAQEKNTIRSYISEKDSIEDVSEKEWHCGFYVGFTAFSLKLSTFKHQDLVNIEELIPQEGLTIPIHPDDEYALAAGVVPFTYDELTNLYTKVMPFHTIGFVPKLGFHVLPVLDLECSYDFLNYNLTTGDFPDSHGMDDWPDQRYKYYMHKYSNGADAFTVIRFKNTYSFRTLHINAILKLNKSDSDELGLILGFQRNFINVVYQAQSGWDRYYKFKAYNIFSEVSRNLITNQLSLGMIYNINLRNGITFGFSFLSGYSKSGLVFVLNIYDWSFNL